MTSRIFRHSFCASGRVRLSRCEPQAAASVFDEAVRGLVGRHFTDLREELLGGLPEDVDGAPEDGLEVALGHDLLGVELDALLVPVEGDLDDP